MLKKILCYALLMVSSVTVSHSQVLISLLFGDKLNTDKISFGLAGGLQLSSISNLESAEFRPTFNIGYFFDFKLADHLYFHQEILMKSNMGARGLPPYPTSDGSLDGLLENAEVDRRINYINAPLLIKYRTDNGWGVEAGPQFSMRTKARDYFEATVSDKENLSLEVDIRDQIRKFDAGFAGGLSRKIGKGLAGITVYARYYVGLVDTHKLTSGRQLNQSVLINATIPIGAGKDLEQIVEEKE